MLPATGGFALDARSLAHLVDLIAREQPAVVLELGSGTSTVWISYLLEGSAARFVSIDHDEYYAGRTRDELTRNGLEHVVDLRVAPLVPVAPAEGDETPRRWYDHRVFADVSDVDLLVVDGPPESTGRLARWPAVPTLLGQLAPGGLVVLDDADRPGEQAIIDMWREVLGPADLEDPGVSRLALLRVPTEPVPEDAG